MENTKEKEVKSIIPDKEEALKFTEFEIHNLNKVFELAKLQSVNDENNLIQLISFKKSLFDKIENVIKNQ